MFRGVLGGVLGASAALVGCGGGGADEIAPGSAHVFVADVARGKVTRLTDGDRRHECPRWSPDGRRLSWGVMLGHDARSDWHVELAPPSGGRTARVDVVSAGGCASWSPDGGRLAFVGRAAGDWRLITVEAAAPERRVALGTHAVPGGEPSWSPDGRSVAFGVLRAAPCPPGVRCPTQGPQPTSPPPVSQDELSVATPSERRERVLTHTPTTIEAAPRFSPDGSWIAFVRARRARSASGPKPSIALMRPDGGRQRNLVGLPRGSGGPPRWSPDGRWIVAGPAEGGDFVPVVAPSGASGGRIAPSGDVSWSRDGRVLVVPTESSIELYRPRDRHVRTLVEVPGPLVTPRQAAVSPDGRTVAYPDPRGLELIDVRTGRRRLLFRTRREQGVEAVAWAPDGRRVAFTVSRESAPS